MLQPYLKCSVPVNLRFRSRLAWCRLTFVSFLSLALPHKVEDLVLHSCSCCTEGLLCLQTKTLMCTSTMAHPQLLICDASIACQKAASYLSSLKTNRDMSRATLRQLLVKGLGERDAARFSDRHIQNLVAKAYTDEGALQDATREGLRSHPALPSALVDKLLKAFGQSGR